MFQRMTVLTALAIGLLGLSGAGGAQPDKKLKPEDQAKVKKALQEVQDFIGVWNLEGTQKVGARTEAWKEKTNWSWKFDKDAAWITVEFEKGKYFSKGDLKYLTDKKKYQLALTAADKSEQVFEGDYT